MPAEDDDQFVEHGNTTTLEPFLAVFAKALQRMPVFEHFLLKCELDHLMGFWETSYYTPGIKAKWGDENGMEIGVRRLYCSVGDIWRPDDLILETSRSPGQEEHGEELIQRFLERRTWTFHPIGIMSRL
jgi:hypothetical protein